MEKTTYFNSSWFYGIHEYGFGNTTYYSYFSEFNRPWVGLGYVEATIFSLLFFFSLFGNVSVVYQIFQLKNTSTVTNMMISNLAIADILFTSGSPFIAVTRISGTWLFGDTLCKILVYSMFVCAAIMIWTMTIISIDRNICINKLSAKKISPRFGLLLIFATWLVWSLLCIPVLKYFHTRQFHLGRDKISICTLSWPMTSQFRVSVFFTVVVCVFAFTIPILIISVNYSKIIRRFLKSRRAVLNNQRQNNLMHHVNSVKRKSRDARDLRVVKTLVLLVFLFFLMWLPIFIVFVVILIDGMHDNMQVPSSAFVWTLLIALANACVNPFLYGVINTRIQRAMLRCFCCRKKMSQDLSQSNEHRQGIKVISYSHSDHSISEHTAN